MSKKESRVRAHTRRTASGQTRVREGRRRRNLAIGAGVGGALALGGLVAAVNRRRAVNNLVNQTVPKTRPIGTKVKLKTRKPRRVTTLQNTQEWADTLEAQKGLPKGVKVEHLNPTKNTRLPKNRQYSTSNDAVYSHGTSLDSLREIKKSGVIQKSSRDNPKQAHGAMYGDGVYLEDSRAHQNMYGAAVFEFPQKNLLKRGFKRHNIGIFTVEDDLPITAAQKLLLKRNSSKTRNVKIRYKRAFNNLINFMAESKVKSHSRSIKPYSKRR